MGGKLNRSDKIRLYTDKAGLNPVEKNHSIAFLNVPTTKFSIPYSNSLKIDRDHMDSRLNEAMKKKLTIVSAPAGYGKTTAVSSWALGKKDGVSFTWIALDKEDNEVSGFWHNLLYSISRNENLAFYEKIPSFSVEAMINFLINNISEASFEHVIILDDYHNIDCEQINRSFEYFLAYLPRNLHCIILSRYLPALSISKMLVDDEVLQIGFKELQFSHEEACTFLNKVMDLKLSDEEMTSLETKTEGWIAALKIAALALKNCPDKSTFINGFSSSRNLSQYLFEEIINCQEAAIKEFLIKTSILKSLNKSICDRLTGFDNSEDMLETLEANKLFIINLDESKTNYRYHSLLSEVLIKLLKKDYPGQIKELYLNASRWYEENGYDQDAFECSISSGDQDNTLRLLENYYAASHSSILGPIRLCRYFEAIPYELFNKNPDLCIRYALALAVTEQVSADEKELADRGIDLDSTLFERCKGQVSLVRSYIAMKYENTVELIKHSELALQQLPEYDLLSVNPCITLGYIYTSLGDIKKAEAYVNKALLISKRAGSVRPYEAAEFLIISNFYLTRIQYLKGQLDDFIEPVNRIIPETILHKNCMYLCLAAAYYDRGEFRQSHETILKGLELYNTYQYIFFDKVKSLVLLARIMLHTGKAPEAAGIMKEIDSLVKPDSGNLFVLLELPKIVNLLALLGLSDRAEAYIDKFSDIQCKEAEFVLGEARAELFLANGRYEEAADILEAIKENVNLKEYPGKRIDLLLLEAMIHEGAGREEKALGCMRRAFEINGVEKNCRSFVERGNAMYALLIRLVHHAKAADEAELSAKAERLVKSFAAENTETSEGRKIEGAEQLSNRELEVLKLLVKGLSYDDIGNTLFVSLSTVKKHTGNIYYKLKAKNRIQAVNIAKANKLVE